MGIKILLIKNIDIKIGYLVGHICYLSEHFGEAKLMKTKRIYLDYNSTTPLFKESWELLHLSLGLVGNPSSIHWAGREAKAVLRECRNKLAAYLGGSPLDYIFTSGGSESNNTAIQSALAWGRENSRNEIMCSAVEHPSVIRTLESFCTEGFKLHKIPVSRDGYLDLEFVKQKLSNKTALVSLMLANNETGNIFPVQKVAKLAHQEGALMHVDAVQALGKIPVSVEHLNADYISFSAHKFYALKSTGVLFVKKSSPFRPLIVGGGQERGRRGGTENVLGIQSLNSALNFYTDIPEQTKRIEKLRDQMETRILNEISEVQITGRMAPRLPNTSSLVFQGVDGESLLMSLDLKSYAVSTGAACSSGNPEPSPVLLSMGLTRDESQSSLRISLGWPTQENEISEFIDELSVIVKRLRSLKSAEVNKHG